VLAANAALLILITLLVKFWKKKDAVAVKAGAGSEDADDADTVITPEIRTKDFAAETVVKRHDRAPKNKKPEEFDVLEFEIVDGSGAVS
jgi:hypothetical protein